MVINVKRTVKKTKTVFLGHIGRMVRHAMDFQILRIPTEQIQLQLVDYVNVTYPGNPVIYLIHLLKRKMYQLYMMHLLFPDLQHVRPLGYLGMKKQQVLVALIIKGCKQKQEQEIHVCRGFRRRNQLVLEGREGDIIVLHEIIMVGIIDHLKFTLIIIVEIMTDQGSFGAI